MEDPEALSSLISRFAAIPGRKVLVHGGGRTATAVASKMGVETRMIGGRRVTDADMLKIVTMVYGGLVNKNIVAKLNASGLCALGMTGADCAIITSHKRPSEPIDYGFAGDIDKVDAKRLSAIIEQGITPVLAPLTCSADGIMLNTNADTIAAETAKALAPLYSVTLIYCFEHSGVLSNPDDETSVIPEIHAGSFNYLVESGTISGGMIPKIHNAVEAVEAGVAKVIVTAAATLDLESGTHILP